MTCNFSTRAEFFPLPLFLEVLCSHPFPHTENFSEVLECVLGTRCLVFQVSIFWKYTNATVLPLLCFLVSTFHTMLWA